VKNRRLVRCHHDCGPASAPTAAGYPRLVISPTQIVTIVCRAPTAPKGLPMPHVADRAPNVEAITEYDEQHRITYIRLLDADKEGADWREVSRILLRIDPDREPGRARTAFETHLARAKWLAHAGYRLLLRAGAWPSQIRNVQANASRTRS